MNAQRRLPRVRFSVRSSDGRSGDTASGPMLPWWARAVVGAAAIALGGWIVVAGLCMLAWVSAMDPDPWQALRAGTQLWLLIHGAGAHIGAITLTLPPLGLTLLVAALLAGVGGYAARSAWRATETLSPARVVWRVALAAGGAYALLVTVPAIVLAAPAQTAKALLASLLVGSLAAGAGAAWTLHWRPTRSWPRWLRSVPRAVAAAVLVALAGGALVVIAALGTRLGRVQTIEASLHAGVVGGLLLWLATMAYAPDLVLWGASYAYGAGFTLGPDTLVSPADTHAGLLPAVPVLGAVPDASPGHGPQLWWLAVGVLAGAAAGVVVVLARRRARADETALVGALAGLLGAVVLVVLAALARGGLGAERLTGMGPRLTELLVMACTLMGLAGMGAGVILGLLRPAPPAATDEETTVID